MNGTFQKVAPIILSILGSSGVVATAILAVKATPKAQKRIKEIKEESLKLNAKTNKLTVIKALAPCYLPTAIVGGITIASIISGTIISKKVEASLSATCIALDQGYKRYKGKVKDILGLDKHQDVIKAIAEDEYAKEHPETPKDDRKLYWNEYTGFFYAKPVDVVKAIHNMCMRLHAFNSYGFIDASEMGYCTLDQFVKESNAELLDKTKFEPFSNFGWSVDYLSDCWDEYWIHYGIHDEETEDKQPYTVIEFLTADPIYDPMGFYEREYES